MTKYAPGAEHAIVQDQKEPDNMNKTTNPWEMVRRMKLK